MAGVANAQTTRFGVKAGVGLATVSGDDVSGTDKKNLVVPQAGIMADVSFSDLISFHPELLYSQKGLRYESGSNYIQSRLSYIDLPLLLRVKADGLFFEAGPQVGFLVAEKDEVNFPGFISGTSTSTDGTRKVDFGYLVGVGYQLPQGLELGIRYNGGIADINDPSGSSKVRNSVFQLQLGYLFGGK
ncbi:MAG: PorT family protein [Hymenobacter sp.]|nr:PorT family protein [Hymenobacter sp.]